MSRPDLYAILDSCVARVGRGEAVEACLATYPQQAGELAPVLAMSADLFQLPRLEPGRDAVDRGYARMMSAAGSSRRNSALGGWLNWPGEGAARRAGRRSRPITPLLKGALVAIMLLAVAGSLVVTAAADTLPGDSLYPFKRSWENARLAVTLQETARQRLAAEMERRRRQEVQAVLDLGRQAEVEFAGLLQSMAADLWLVDGLEVHITAETEISGDMLPGQKVAVRARVASDGVLTGLKVAAIVDPARPPALPSPSPRPAATRAPAATEAPAIRPSASPRDPAVSDSVTTRSADIAPTRPPTQQPTATPEPTYRPTQGPTATPETTRPPGPGGTPEPTLASHQDVAPTPTPEKQPTEPSAANATATQKPVTDVRPSPTPTGHAVREPTPTHETTPTPESNSAGNIDRPP